VILWRREPKFKKVVRPEKPVEKVYCRVLEPENVTPGSPCKVEKGEIPRLYGVWAVPHRESKLTWVGEEKFGVIGGTFLLYPSILRPGACTDDRGTAGLAFTCVYPDITEYDEDKDKWRYSLKGKYFRLRDDVEEVGGYEDKFGHPVYIVRNGLGETFRMTGVYARLYHVLRERGGWVKGLDLLNSEGDMLWRYRWNLNEFVERKRQEELEELTVEYGNTALEVAGRLTDLTIKLNRGEVGELPQPGRVPADLERMLVELESQELLHEVYVLYDLAEKRRDELGGGDTWEAFWVNYNWYTVLALGLLVYEALIVEMGVE
jgi:hypothetical protein